MKPVILLAHPYCKSFNHHVKDVVVESFKQSGKDPVVIDLSDEGFNPVLSTEDLRSPELAITKKNKLVGSTWL